MTQNREGIIVNFKCIHPELAHNICPTGKGNCEDCRYCIAVLSAKYYFELERRANHEMLNT